MFAGHLNFFKAFEYFERLLNRSFEYLLCECKTKMFPTRRRLTTDMQEIQNGLWFKVVAEKVRNVSARRAARCPTTCGSTETNTFRTDRVRDYGNSTIHYTGCTNFI